jgi:hypothetical protein
MERTTFEIAIGIILLFLSWIEMMIFMDWLTIALFFAWPVVSITKVFDGYPWLKLASKIMTIGVILWAAIGFLLFAFGFTGMDINVNEVFRYLVG